ncbi:MAG: hypothetical protein Q8J84_05495 [Flavobacteriaceae bacterium]|nr:hypothetical protein [Flavobacteriaceae bacterium]
MRKLIIIFSLLFVTSSVVAQVTKSKDTLKTETINVVKSFKPTVSDAYKLNENPSIQEDAILVKEKIQYEIQSVPVASTFTPAKGKAQVLERPKKELLYDSFLSVGYGNFSSPLVESFLKFKAEKDDFFSIYGFYNSSKNGVSNTIIEDEFSKMNFQATYHHQEQYYNWQAKAIFENKKTNWYGLPEPEAIAYSTSFIENLNPKQQYQTIGIDGKIDFKEFFLEDVKTGISYFKDDYSSNEIQLFAKTGLSFPISTEKIHVEADVDLLKGKFEKAYNTTTDLEHSFLKFGLKPSLEVLRENFQLNLGVNLTYSFDLEHRESKLYSYPNVYASYKLMDDLLIPFLGVTGELKTNSYKNMVEKNPFVSPTLVIKETDQAYNAFFGIKGNLSNSLNYQLKTSYIKEKNKPMFLLNQNKSNGILPVNYGYEAGNSFGLVYDKVTTFEIEGDLNLALSDEFYLKGNLIFSNYDTENFAEAFNLPTYKTTLSADYQTNKWFANSSIYLVGETIDIEIPYGLYMSFLPFDPSDFIIKNKAYVDVNIDFGYHFSNRLTAFAKVNNLLNGNHQPYAHYKVQGLQAIAGITYKFDL